MWWILYWAAAFFWLGVSLNRRNDDWKGVLTAVFMAAVWPAMLLVVFGAMARKWSEDGEKTDG